MTEAKPKVFLVDDHETTRAGTRVFLQDRFDIVGEADDTDAAIELIRDRQPDLVVLDVRLPGGGGAAVLEAVRRSHPDVKFLAFTMSTSREDVMRLLELGVDGYVTKTEYGSDLPDLVAQALDGGRPISRDVAGYLLGIDEATPTDAAGIERLTPREREVVNLIARGYTYRETASRLEMAVKTLESHISNIFRKLGVASRHQLTALAYDTSFVRPDDD
jgi:DNA-binding NarL/FixJ family response regulator